MRTGLHTVRRYQGQQGYGHASADNSGYGAAAGGYGDAAGGGYGAGTEGSYSAAYQQGAGGGAASGYSSQVCAMRLCCPALYSYAEKSKGNGATCAGLSAFPMPVYCVWARRQQNTYFGCLCELAACMAAVGA